MNRMPIGTIFMSQNTRLIVVGYYNNINYLACICDDNNVFINRAFIVTGSQVEKVLSYGYSISNNNITRNNVNNNGSIVNSNNGVINSSVNNSFSFDPFKNTIVPTDLMER